MGVGGGGGGDGHGILPMQQYITNPPGPTPFLYNAIQAVKERILSQGRA